VTHDLGLAQYTNCVMRLIVGFMLLTAGGAWSQEMVRIPASSAERVDARSGVTVTVRTRAFLIGATEVTQGDYEKLMVRTPAIYKGDKRPVESVSWWEAIRYCNRRSEREGLLSVYDPATGRADRRRNGYRLPTEAEWVAAGGEEKSEGRLGTANTKSMAALAEPRIKGTAEVAAGKPNSRGVYDLMGNVWEWCEDWFDAEGSVTPGGPSGGIERVIRGGSFLTPATGWTKGFRSSLEPGRQSKYTGFRVARNDPGPEEKVVSQVDWFAPFAARPQVPAMPAVGGISKLREKWVKLLGSPYGKGFVPEFKVVESFRESTYDGTLGYLGVELGGSEKVLVMRPAGAGTRKLPVVIVPFYDVDAPAGRNLGGRNFAGPGVRSFAYLAVQRGYMAVAIRWFGEGYGESYTEAVANLAERHPGCTGLGKWVWDAQRLVDFLQAREDVDQDRIAMMGHSLGGKMTLYAAALDPRIRVAVASEPGMGLGYSNYEDYWYWGERLKELPAGTDQHELLGMMAPRPFLLIAGDSADGDRSMAYLDAARPLYGVNGLGFINHRSGHSPTLDSVRRAMDWVEHWFDGALR